MVPPPTPTTDATGPEALYGRIPRGWKQQLDDQGLDFATRGLARHMVWDLQGLEPLKHADAIRERYLANGWDGSLVDQALAVLSRIGYGRGGRKARRLRDHGSRLGRHPHCLPDLLGKIPRAAALRVPRTANNRMTGPREGRDVWGTVYCSDVLRAYDLGLWAWTGGLYMSCNPQAHPYVEFTAGQACYQLVSARRASKRNSGRDYQDFLHSLTKLANLELRANGGGEAYEIPAGPFDRVEQRWDDEWLSLEEYAQRVKDLPADQRPPFTSENTFRVHIAQWVRDHLANKDKGESGRRVIVDFNVYRQIQPFDRCFYFYLQGLGRAPHDPDSVTFYAADPVKFTLGITAKADRAVRTRIQAAITNLYSVDERITGYSKVVKRAGTNIDQFTVHVARGKPSRARFPDRVGKVFDWTQTLPGIDAAEIILGYAERGSPPRSGAPPG